MSHCLNILVIRDKLQVGRARLTWTPGLNLPLYLHGTCGRTQSPDFQWEIHRVAQKKSCKTITVWIRTSIPAPTPFIKIIVHGTTVLCHDPGSSLIYSHAFLPPFKHSASKSSCTAAERNCVGWRGAFSRESLFEFSMVTKGLINILGFRSRQYEFMGTNSYPLSVCLFGSKNGNMHSFFFFFFFYITNVSY